MLVIVGINSSKKLRTGIFKLVKLLFTLNELIELGRIYSQAKINRA